MLDIEQGEALLNYLRTIGHIEADDAPKLHNLAGGVSNRTVLVEHADGTAWVMKQALEKLRVKVDWFSSPERIHREAAGLRWMQHAVPEYSPPLVFEDVNEHLLAMRAVPQPHINWKTQLLQGVVEQRYVEQFGWLLGTIQRVAVEGKQPQSNPHHPAINTPNPLAPAVSTLSRRLPSPVVTGEGGKTQPPPQPTSATFAGNIQTPPQPSPVNEGGSHTADETRKLFSDRTFFETLRVEPYYSYSAAQVPEAAGFISELIEATRSRNLTLVHGDYSPKNVLIHGGRIVLLDYEVIHWGDPAFDVGFSMTHFLSKAHVLPEHRGAFAAAARIYWKSYWQEIQGLTFAADLEGYAVRHTLACLLARVAGRSPLEYLDGAQRAHQQAVVVGLMGDIPATVDELVERFTEGI